MAIFDRLTSAARALLAPASLPPVAPTRDVPVSAADAGGVIRGRVVRSDGLGDESLWAVRQDNWKNPITGFGTSRDKTQAGAFFPDYPLLWTELSNLYYYDDIAAVIVDALPDEAMRKGFSLLADDKEAAEELHNYARDVHDFEARFNEAVTWGRLFGGALMIFGADDGKDLAEPLDEKRVKSILWTFTVDRRNIIPAKYYEALGPKVGQVEVYRVIAQTERESVSFLVHESRCIRFGGVPADHLKKRELYGWDIPVLQRPYNAMRQFADSYTSVSVMMADASQGVYKLKDLIKMVGEGNLAAIRARLEAADMGRSTVRGIVIDAENEDFTKVATQFSGVPEIMDRYMMRLSAASGVPVTKLFGKSPAGLNATGESDAENWYATAGSYQTKTLSPKLLRAFHVYALAKDSPMRGKQLVKPSVEWAPLQVPTQKEDAEAYSTRANADAVYIDKGVLDPAEVAIARFGRGRYSPEAPAVDVDALQEEMDQRATFDDPSGESDPETPGKASDLDTETGSGANVTISAAGEKETSTEGATLEQGEADASAK